MPYRSDCSKKNDSSVIRPISRSRTTDERRRGNFRFRSRAFLHFHADGDELYADVRLHGHEFERHRVTSDPEQTALVTEIRAQIGRT
jgi:hypothetical protein